MKRTPLRRRSKAKAAADAIYSAFRAEWLDGRACEKCGTAVATEIHHRRTRGHRGHLTLPANAARLCHACHRWVHDNPREAHDLGWLVWPGDPDWQPLAARPDRSTP